MKKTYQNNYAFIDGQNLYLGVKAQGWLVDYKKLRVYLSEKYGVERAFMFLGYIPNNRTLYEQLKRDGYDCVFKETIISKKQPIKGNVDAELVLHAMIEYSRYDKAVIVSGDGDFQCLARYLCENDKLLKILAPNKKQCSILLKKVYLQGTKNTVVDYMNNLRRKLEK